MPQHCLFFFYHSAIYLSLSYFFIHSIHILSILLTGSVFSMMINYVLIDVYLKLRVYY